MNKQKQEQLDAIDQHLSQHLSDHLSDKEVREREPALVKQIAEDMLYHEQTIEKNIVRLFELSGVSAWPVIRKMRITYKRSTGKVRIKASTRSTKPKKARKPKKWENHDKFMDRKIKYQRKLILDSEKRAAEKGESK